jgi:hypothetical protein
MNFCVAGKTSHEAAGDATVGADDAGPRPNDGRRRLPTSAPNGHGCQISVQRRKAPTTTQRQRRPRRTQHRQPRGRWRSDGRRRPQPGVEAHDDVAAAEHELPRWHAPPAATAADEAKLQSSTR